VIDRRAKSPAAAAKITKAELPVVAANYRRKNCLLLLPKTALRFSRLISAASYVARHTASRYDRHNLNHSLGATYIKEETTHANQDQ
jgi:hypothetical protein